MCFRSSENCPYREARRWVQKDLAAPRLGVCMNERSALQVHCSAANDYALDYEEREDFDL